MTPAILLALAFAPAGAVTIPPPEIGEARPVSRNPRAGPEGPRGRRSAEEVVDLGTMPLQGALAKVVAGGRLVVSTHGLSWKGMMSFTAEIVGDQRDPHGPEDPDRCRPGQAQMVPQGKACHFWVTSKDYVAVRWRLTDPAPNRRTHVELVVTTYEVIE